MRKKPIRNSMRLYWGGVGVTFRLHEVEDVVRQVAIPKSQFHKYFHGKLSIVFFDGGGCCQTTRGRRCSACSCSV